VSRAELDERYRIFHANALGLLAYRPQRYDGPVTLVNAEGSPDVAAEWKRVATGPFRSETVSGDHYAIVSSEVAASLARIVDGTLADTGGGSW
jgi:hypothetical protein